MLPPIAVFTFEWYTYLGRAGFTGDCMEAVRITNDGKNGDSDVFDITDMD